jgi:hypothetical protein
LDKYCDENFRNYQRRLAKINKQDNTDAMSKKQVVKMPIFEKVSVLE